MEATGFAVYLHPETISLSKPLAQIPFVGYSVPHFSRIREELARRLVNYPQLRLRKAEWELFKAIAKPAYLDAILELSEDRKPLHRPRWSAECVGMQYALEGYQFGLGGMIEAIDQMKAGRLDRAYCFCLGGHHAYADWGHGYCILNPLATAIRYAQQCGFHRVVVLDWDIHHDDGTQMIFANDPTVYCISVHSYPDLYMSSIGVLRQGTTVAGEKAGHCNIPILHEALKPAEVKDRGFSGDYFSGEESLHAVEDALCHLPWSPDLLCVFSGYDAHRDDCGARSTHWANEDFATLTGYVLRASRKAGCPLLSVHGGGYKLAPTIAAACLHIDLLARQQT